MRRTAVAAAVTAAVLINALVLFTAPARAGDGRVASADCASGSSADFPNAYGRSDNLVVGPLAIVGAGGPTSAETVRRFGGNKFPLLLKAGHSVTISVAQSVEDIAALGYGPALPQGPITLRTGYREETFVACSAERSSSTADGPVTFWSGGLVAERPVCVPLDVKIDGARTAQRVYVALGAPCPR